jgi:transposase
MEPDFQAQKSMLEEHCAKQGYEVIFFPKFHLELNFIEQCWGYAKRVYRMFPESSSEEDLEWTTVAAAVIKFCHKIVHHEN